MAAEGTWQGIWPLNDVNAAIRLSDGRVASPTLPVGLEAVNLTLNVNQDRLALNGEARSGKGQLQLSGTGALGADWHMQVQLDGKDVDVRQPPRLTARMDPALTLTATAETVVLSGRLDITDGLLRLDQNPDRVDLSPDIVVVRQAASGEVPEDKGPDFVATVVLNVVKPLSVQGYGADLKLRGSVTLLQTPDSVPSGYGTLTLTEGRFEKYGQKLQLRSGQVQFSGPVTDPWIRLEAIREVPPVVAGIRLEGPASAPVATPFSEPALPPDHVMYYLLTGRAPGDNTASEKAMVSRAMLSIGLYGATPLTQKMADIFGIEGFGIETTGQGDETAISVSGYLSPRLYVEYGFGVFTPVNTLTTRYRLSKNLYLEAVSGVENLLNVLYRFEF
ncbi:translocation/assembly module TamB domain-containing protein [Hahella sp. SMD15-11]|uniref:Translocation/assembly module TamB domain-containing protein n=1 Tax=Thermohahella caldifontis TaxID=3142973 RepID=A0AB39UUL6_9GAMM